MSPTTLCSPCFHRVLMRGSTIAAVTIGRTRSTDRRLPEHSGGSLPNRQPDRHHGRPRTIPSPLRLARAATSTHSRCPGVPSRRPTSIHSRRSLKWTRGPRRPTRRGSCACSCVAGWSSARTPRPCSTLANPRPSLSSARSQPTRVLNTSGTSTRDCPARRCPRSSPVSRRVPWRVAKGSVASSWKRSSRTLASRGFAAVEAYPDLTLGVDEASTATPAFWEACGFELAIHDERFPVMRRELD